MANPSRRAEIIAAATDLFDRRGYWGTSMEDIATVVGVRASSLYNHCSSKQELLGEICMGALLELIVTHDERLATTQGAPEQIAAAMDVHVRYHVEHGPQVRISNREVTSLQDPWAGKVRHLRRDYVARWVTIIENGIAAEDFQSDDPKISSYFLIDMATGVSTWFRPDRRYSIEELAARYTDDALRMLANDRAQL